ncbi:MAG: 2OG-Fe(II) oxygenase [Burkholderiales bacterium]
MRAPSDALIDALAAQGFSIAREALPDPVVRGLRDRARALDAAGGFAAAGVGRGDARLARRDIRGDRIAWLPDASADPAEHKALAWLDALRLRCNRELMLGLEALEAHYAIYPPGTRYARHRDRFRDDDARVLSCIVYLNEDWTADDGGALRLYAGEETVEVLPEGGTVVVFLAADFEHEVLPARRERLALTGWFRRRVLV